ncbi:Gfo/Idh/MocA family oxidoreductase [Angustibacter peucedani]
MSASGEGSLGVGMVGYAFMGAAHSQAWRNAPAFFDLPVHPAMNVLCGRDTAAAGETARKFGWRDVVGDWKELLRRDDVQLVDVCTPGDTHAEISIAALEAGRHVLCEKPLANSVAEAQAMVDAAEAAAAQGVRSMVGFTYRRVPAIALARQLVQQGRLGTIRHVRAQYLQDWLSDPASPLSWRLQKERAGSGALGDIGAHVVDLVQHVTGLDVTSVTAALETFVTERPLPVEQGQLGGRGGTETGEVTVDDAAVFLARLEQGVLGVFEATRFASGRKNAIRLEVNGSAGSIAFDFEQMNELWFHDHTEDAEVAGFRRVLVTEPSHPYVGGWWPAGHLLGYEHAFTHQVVDLVGDVAAGRDPAPSFADGLQVQKVLAAVETSAASGAWQQVQDQV